MGWKVVGVAALAACGMVFLGSATASAPPGPRSVSKPLGVIKRTAAVRPATRAATTGSSPSGYAIDPNLQLTYHGGPVMHTHTVYVIYWLPSGFNFGADAGASTTYENDINQYIQDVGADSGKTSNAFGTISQYSSRANSNVGSADVPPAYSDPGGAVHYQVAFGGSVVSTAPLPASGCTEATNCLIDSQLITQIDSVVNSQGWSGGFTNQFALVLPQGVTTCFDNTNASCSDNFFCAYHNAYDHGIGTTAFMYLNLPYESADACHNDFTSTQPTPNGQPDVLIDDLSHEEREAATDPLGSAWFDSNGNEADDKCIDTYGTTLTSVGDFNQLINGNEYDAQTEWSNAIHGCYQGKPGAPSVSLDSTSAVAGATIGISGTNFVAASPNKPIVKFNGITVDAGSVTVDSPEHMTVTVPGGNTNGKVTVQGFGGTGTSAQTFALPPHISSLGATTGQVGDLVTVNGTGFFKVASVTFGGVKATFKNVAADGISLQAVVPQAAVDGHVVVTTPGGVATGTDTFHVTPKIASFSPAAAIAGKSVTITGSGLASATSVEWTGGVTDGPITLTSANKLVVTVPSDAQVGTLTVHSSDGNPITATGFKAVPSIDHLNVVDGKSGDTVEVFGANLLGETLVKFGSCSSPSITKDIAEEVDAKVPDGPGGLCGTVGFSSGKIAITTPGGTATSQQVFAVTKVTKVTPTNAPAGTVITITGQGLSSAAAVDFPGHSGGVAPAGTPTPTTVKVVVPNDATVGALTVNTNDPVPTPTFMPAPKITGFDEASYQVGDTVTVTGSNFTANGSLTATLGGISLCPCGESATGFSFTVPDTVTGTLIATNGDGTAKSPTMLAVRPTISSLSAGDATIGSLITITGKTFVGTKSVKFGNNTESAQFKVLDATHLQVTVPTSATGGKIGIVNAGGTTQTASDFVIDPFVKSFSPVTAPVGATLTIMGNGFQGADTVQFGGDITAPASNINASGTSLKVVVPPGVAVTPRGLEVHTAAAGFGPQSATLFTVTFSITGMSSASGPYNGDVILTGVGLADVTEVDFNGHPGAIQGTPTDTSIDVHVPASGTVDGPVTVTKGTLTIAAPQSFTLLTVDSFSTTAGPTGTGILDAAGSSEAGPPGSTVVIHGHGFSAATGVKFNATSAVTFTVNSDTQITVTVPTAATSGTISVVVPAGSVGSSDSFTVETGLAGVVVNEVRTDGSGFIEIYNGSGSTVDIGNTWIVWRDAASGLDVTVDHVDAPTTIAAGGFFFIGIATLDATGGGVAIEYPTSRIVIDSVGWGTATNAFVEGTAKAAPGAGHSIGRSPDGTDTNHNSTDFVDESAPSPGATNP